MLQAVRQRLPVSSMPAGPRWLWLLLLLILVTGTASVVLSLSVGRIERRADEIEMERETSGRWLFKTLMDMQTTMRQDPYRMRAAQLGLGEPMTVTWVGFPHRKTFEWRGRYESVTFTITELRDKTAQIKIDGHVANKPAVGRVTKTRFATVDAILPTDPGIAVSLRPAVNIAGLPDLHIVILEALPRATIAVGPKAERPSWGALRRE